jgi:hypothetical protein
LGGENALQPQSVYYSHQPRTDCAREGEPLLDLPAGIQSDEGTNTASQGEASHSMTN